jgi:hypothetical protein
MSTVVDGRLVSGPDLPAPVRVRIQSDGSGVLLLRLDADGDCVADTWHETIAAAKAQARLEFEIGDDEWFERES